MKIKHNCQSAAGNIRTGVKPFDKYQGYTRRQLELVLQAGPGRAERRVIERKIKKMPATLEAS